MEKYMKKKIIGFLLVKKLEFKIHNIYELYYIYITVI